MIPNDRTAVRKRHVIPPLGYYCINLANTINNTLRSLKSYWTLVSWTIKTFSKLTTSTVVTGRVPLEQPEVKSLTQGHNGDGSQLAPCKPWTLSISLKAGKHATITILYDKNSIFQSDRPNPGDNTVTSIDRLPVHSLKWTILPWVIENTVTWSPSPLSESSDGWLPEVASNLELSKPVCIWTRRRVDCI